LDDLIVGARYADPSGKLNAGKSYVVFGKADGSAIDLSAIADANNPIGGFVQRLLCLHYWLLLVWLIVWRCL
jgi:isocitrate/isopropylmalate dehydrogenase